MRKAGLSAVDSAQLLSSSMDEDDDDESAGAVMTVVQEGIRPIIIEIQVRGIQGHVCCWTYSALGSRETCICQTLHPEP